MAVRFCQGAPKYRGSSSIGRALAGKVSYYTPDFWIEELKGYLEVKGYETDLDRCKWKQFPEMLTIWKKEEIKNLEWSHNGIGADC